MNSFGKGLALADRSLVALVQGLGARRPTLPSQRPPRKPPPGVAASAFRSKPHRPQHVPRQWSDDPRHQRRGRPKVNFHSAPPPQDLKKKDLQTKPGNPSDDRPSSQRDERRNRLAARVRALLVTEIQGLESLFASTPKSAPDRPQLARRLAEDYVELEAAAFRDKTEAGIKIDEAKRKNPGAVAKLQQSATQASEHHGGRSQEGDRLLHPAQERVPQLLGRWTRCSTTSPTSTSRRNDLDNARKVYYELIQKAPQSKYIPNAYLAFGELFFNEAQGDPSKWDLAAAPTKKSSSTRRRTTRCSGTRTTSSRYVYWNKGEFPRSLDEFKKTIDFGIQFASLPNAAQLAIAARRDLVPVYALSGRPDAAYNFFKNLSGDASGENAKTLKMMDDLGQNYLDTGHYPEAIALYHDLMSRDKGDQLLRVPGARDAGHDGHEVGQQGADQDRARSPDRGLHRVRQADATPPRPKRKCANMTAELLAETAMAWHLEAVGSGGVRGTGDQKTMSARGVPLPEGHRQLHARAVRQVRVPAHREGRLADDLQDQVRHGRLAVLPAALGRVRSRVRRRRRRGPAVCRSARKPRTRRCSATRTSTKRSTPTRAIAKAAATYLVKARRESKADEAEKFKPKAFTVNQTGMITAFNRYVCYIKPKEGDKQALEQYIEVKYARARTYFEAQHWEEAAIGFRDVAVTYPDKDVGIYAAQLYLESLNVLGTHSDPPKPACFDSMAQDVPLFLKLYCEGANFQKNQEQCTSLTKIQCDIARLKAQKTVELADRGGPQRAQALREGRQRRTSSFGEPTAKSPFVSAARCSARRWTRSSTTRPAPSRRLA